MKIKELLNKLDFSSLQDKNITLIHHDLFLQGLNYQPQKFYNLEKHKVLKRVCYYYADETYWHGSLSSVLLNRNILNFSIITNHFDVFINITTN